MQVGDELYWVPRQSYGKRGTVSVEKVGRIWAYLSNRYRVDVKTLEADGGGFSSPGRCFTSEAEYLRHTAAWDAWQKFQQRVSHSYGFPPGMTLEKIHAMTELLDSAAD